MRVLTVALGVAAAPVVAAPADAAPAYTLEVRSELAADTAGVALLDALLSQPVPDGSPGVRVDLEVVDGPGDRDGDTPVSPDTSCLVLPGLSRCSAQIPVPAGSRNLVRAWIDVDAEFNSDEADHGEGRNAGPGDCVTGDPAGACPAPGTAGSVNEPDLTDVVQINGTNAAPVARDDTASTRPNAAVTVPVLSNDSDPEAGALAIASWTQPEGGRVTAGSAGEVVFTPARGFHGTTGFGYTITDNAGQSATARVSVSVTSP